MAVPKGMLEITEYTGKGYKPVTHFQKWRTAVLNHIDELEPAKIKKIQKHDKTDEVFVLVKGKCILFLMEVTKGKVSKIYAIDMEPLRVYVVKKGTWHTHTLTKDAMVFIVENEDTSLKNSPVKHVGKKEQAEYVKYTKALWETFF
jgi:hypothetical protein